MTPEQRKAIEHHFDYQAHGHAELRCDGHKITLATRIVRRTRLVIAVYVDGYIKGEDFKQDSEIGAKFWATRKIYLHSPARRAQLAKDAKRRHIGKEIREFFAKQADAHYIHHEPNFPSARAALKKFMSTCADIEVVQIAGVAPERYIADWMNRPAP